MGTSIFGLEVLDVFIESIVKGNQLTETIGKITNNYVFIYKNTDPLQHKIDLHSL